jgi:hypothetical protein
MLNKYPTITGNDHRIISYTGYRNDATFNNFLSSICDSIKVVSIKNNDGDYTRCLITKQLLHFSNWRIIQIYDQWKLYSIIGDNLDNISVKFIHDHI